MKIFDFTYILIFYKRVFLSLNMKLSKTEAREQIKDFFTNLKDKNPKQVKKMKRLAMGHNLQLRELKKRFCKKCLTPYKNPKIRIKNKIKSVICKECGYVNRWKIS